MLEKQANKKGKTQITLASSTHKHSHCGQHKPVNCIHTHVHTHTHTSTHTHTQPIYRPQKNKEYNNSAPQKNRIHYTQPPAQTTQQVIKRTVQEKTLLCSSSSLSKKHCPTCTCFPVAHTHTLMCGVELGKGWRGGLLQQLLLWYCCVYCVCYACCVYCVCCV